MNILITGGAGYIGSHTCVEMISAGYDIVVIDNFSNSCAESIRRVEKITDKKIKFYEEDLCDKAALRTIFSENNIEAVIHFAGFKSIGESIEKPLMYYENNLVSTISLVSVMEEFGVRNLVFSSTAAVYSYDNPMPITETMKLGPNNPYGKTKLIIEEILRDLYAGNKDWCIALLRYFNPIGAHKSGLIGESPRGIPNNLMPYISQVAAGKLEKLYVYGNDYDTHDGTGSRDFIHVVDLARGHVKAIEWAVKNTGCEAFNLGTGKSTTVFELRDAFMKVTGKEVPYVIAPRRDGDLGDVYALPAKAKEVMGWEAKLDILDMCEDAWRWQTQNPNGFD